MAQAVVVGASVAGLAAAVAVRRLGWDVDVFDERPAAEANAGSGLVLWPNAQAALAALGVPGPGPPDLGLSLVASDGAAISGAGAAELRARLGGCPRLVLRESLMNDLLRTAIDAGANVVYGRRLTGVRAPPTDGSSRCREADRRGPTSCWGATGSGPRVAVCSRRAATSRGSGPGSPTVA